MVYHLAILGGFGDSTRTPGRDPSLDVSQPRLPTSNFCDPVLCDGTWTDGLILIIPTSSQSYITLQKRLYKITLSKKFLENIIGTFGRTNGFLHVGVNLGSLYSVMYSAPIFLDLGSIRSNWEKLDLDPLQIHNLPVGSRFDPDPIRSRADCFSSR